MTVSWPSWMNKEAAIWALVAALLLEGGCNLLTGKTIWHRLTSVEHHVQELEEQRKLEEMQTNFEIHELRQKAEQNTEQVKEVEEKVEKKKPH